MTEPTTAPSTLADLATADAAKGPPVPRRYAGINGIGVWTLYLRESRVLADGGRGVSTLPASDEPEGETDDESDDPRDPYEVIDLRYSMLPDRIDPLWGIRLDPAASGDAFSRFVTQRRLGRGDRAQSRQLGLPGLAIAGLVGPEEPEAPAVLDETPGVAGPLAPYWDCARGERNAGDFHAAGVGADLLEPLHKWERGEG